MARNLTIEQWNALLAPLIEQLGDASFHEGLGAVLKALTGHESCVLVAFAEGEPPTLLHDDLSPTEQAVSLAPYLDGAYVLDPFYAVFKEHSQPGVFSLADCAPDGFKESEYYRTYYLHTGLVAETGALMMVDDGVGILASLGTRHTSVPVHNDIPEPCLSTLASLCRKHRALCAHNRTQTLSRPLDVAFRNFGSSVLSNREREVVQLILKGHSNKSIARLLGISIDTVKVYNKRFHTKLGVSSQAELFSLFLEAIATAPLGEDSDPLTAYVEATSNS